jgi:hypothetical protein
MLQDIIDSKYKSVIVPFLLLATPRTFSLLELSRRLEIPAARLQQELADLVRMGLVKTSSKNKQTYYLINSKHKSLLDLKHSLLKNQKGFDDELFIAIKKLGDIKASFLSGLFTGHPELPVDILIVGKPNLNKLDEFLTNAKKMMGQEVNYSVMTEEEFVIRRDTFDRFIKDVFDYPHIVVMDNVKTRPKKP